MKKKLSVFFTITLGILVSLGFAVDEYFDRKEHKDNIATYGSLVPLMNIPDNISVTQKADIVREFINSNSLHGMNEEFYSHWGKHSTIAMKLAAYARGDIDKPIYLECSSRGGAMELTLEALGIKTRNISIIAHDKNFSSHAFLEVYDPELKQWHVQDPGYDTFWRSKQTKKRLSIIDIVRLGVDAIEPCHSLTECGWSFDNKDAQDNVVRLKEYLGSAVVKDKFAKTRDLYVNENIFKLDEAVNHPQEGEITYCQYLDKNCRGNITRYH